MTTFDCGGRALTIQAHRGYSARYPENTLLAFDQAIRAGAGQIELDIRLAQDDVVFAFHDADLDRTTNGSGRLGNTPSSVVKGLDAGSWFDPRFAGERVPTVDEVLDLAKGRARVNVEIKTNHEPLWKKGVQLTVRAVTDHGMWDQVMMSSFNWDAVLCVRELKPDAAVGYLDHGAVAVPETLQARGVKVWWPYGGSPTAAQVAQFRSAGLGVLRGGCNVDATRFTDLQHLVELGCDTISTNYAGEVVELLRSERMPMCKEVSV